MEQKRIGSFLKELRKEKNITQEQFAEKMNVSGRTVSRWETGTSMPDISLLVEIADFYGVDVREIMEGERKSEMMNEELRDVANKMADYAGTEKNRLLKVIQIIGFLGVLVMTWAIILQCIHYKPDPFAAGAMAASFFALMAMVVITFYVAVVVEKPTRKKGFATALKIGVIVLSGISIAFIIRLLIVFGVAWADYKMPVQAESGIDHYNKQEMIKNYGQDMDSGFMVFPDTTDGMLDASFESSVKSGLLDSDGFIILSADYTQEAFRKEVQRLSQISCQITYKEQTVPKNISYDEEMYRYPAYIASDGFDHVYEYALIDEENNSIVYLLLSYPDLEDLEEYRDYLKINPEAYESDKSNVLENFTIYAHKFPGTDVWMEYSKEQ